MKRIALCIGLGILLSMSTVVYAKNSEVSETQNTYESELTGLEIDSNIKNKRPVAIMIDNELKALPHFSVGEADIVYEMMNSTANKRITRLMCLYKDYENIDRIGSVRSVRPTHIPIASEYNAILIHEGGPALYISEPLSNDWIDDLNGGFSRLKNGKSMEFTEFVLQGEVDEHARKSKVSLDYNDYKPKRNNHFCFSDEVILNLTYKFALSNTIIDLKDVYPHTQSKLEYNADTLTYDYYLYNILQKDSEDADVVSFKNIILQCADCTELDANGYMEYDIIGKGNGYYFVNGNYIPIIWEKLDETAITKFYDINGNEVNIAKGKTYINIIPSEYWAKIILK